MKENIVNELDKVREKIANELLDGKDIIIKKSKEGIKIQALKIKNIK